MHDSSAMRFVEGIGNLNRVLERSVERARSVPKPRLEGLAFQVGHDQERRAVLRADVIQGAERRMSELRDDARFTIEALAELRIGGEGGQEDLDSDRAVQPCVAGFVDFPHAASTDDGEDLVWAEARARSQSHVRPTRGL